jgi:hypothetical protein
MLPPSIARHLSLATSTRRVASADFLVGTLMGQRHFAFHFASLRFPFSESKSLLFG